jgi:hypothetical protein
MAPGHRLAGVLSGQRQGRTVAENKAYQFGKILFKSKNYREAV